MRKQNIKIVLFLLLSFLLMGCSTPITHKNVVTNSNTEIEKTDIIGSIAHGLTDLKNEDGTEETFLSYTGGEMCLDYTVCTSGIGNQGIGFMIFIDGNPQLYRTDKEEEYKYMHIFYLEDNVERLIHFYFVPSVGIKGDELDLCISSIYNPEYIPDMKINKGYGIYHDMLESIYLIKYYDTPSLNSNAKKNIAVTNTEKEEIDIETESIKGDSFAYRLFIDDKDVSLGNYCDIAKKEKISLRLEISGIDKAEYICTFFIDHNPCEAEEPLYISTQSNKKTVLKANLSIAGLKGSNSLYAVIVPRNATKLPISDIRLEKTNSVLLVRETIEEKIDSEETSETDSMGTEDQSTYKEQLEDSDVEKNATEENVTEENATEIDTSISGSEIHLDKFSGSIAYASEGKLMIISDDVKLMDMNTLEILAESDNLDKGVSLYDFWDYDILPCTDGYIIYGNLNNKEDGTLYLTMLKMNKEMKIQSIVNVSKLLNLDNSINSYKLFENGNKLIYSMMDGFYLYDFEADIIQTLFENEVSVTDCDIRAGSNVIFFTGEDTGNQRIFGIMDLNSKNLSLREEKHLWGNLWCFDDYILVQEADVYGKENEQVVFCLKPTGNLQVYPLSDKKENMNIIPSNEGNYYATRTRIKGEGFFVRIYASENGKLIREIPMLFSEYGEKFRLSNLLIYEKEKKIILSVSGWKNGGDGIWIVSMDF